MASTSAAQAGTQAGTALTQGHGKVIFASSLGTVFEWYDFYLYGSLAAIIARQFFQHSIPPADSSSLCLPLPQVLRCARSARWCSVASVT